MWTPLGAAHGGRAYLSKMQIGALGPKEEAKRTRGRKVVVMTFVELQHAVGQLSREQRMELWRTCPAAHPPETLLMLETSRSSDDLLRYCPRCFVVFAEDGRAITAPGRRWER